MKSKKRKKKKRKKEKKMGLPVVITDLPLRKSMNCWRVRLGGVMTEKPGKNKIEK